MSSSLSSKSDEKIKVSEINTASSEINMDIEEVTKTKEPVTEVQSKKTSSSRSEPQIQTTARGEVLKKTEKVIDEHMPPVFDLGENIIKSKKKGGFLFFRHDVEDSEETKDVKLKIEMIQTFLTNPIPPAQLDSSNNDAFKEELEGTKLAVNAMYNQLIQSMDTWLQRSHQLADSSKERISMITNLRKQIVTEESLFAQNLLEYRAKMFKDAEKGDNDQRTWLDMLRFQRAEKIDLDSNELYSPDDIKQLGGGTSDLLRIKHEGRYVFFKQEEDMAVGLPSDIIASCAKEKIFKKLDSGDVKKFIKAVKKMENEAPDDIDSVLYNQFFYLSLREDIYKDLKSGTTDFHRFLEKIPKKRQAEFQKFFKHVFKRFNQQIVATTDAMIPEGRNISRRNVATSRLASLLGISDMIPESRTAIVKYKGKELRGNLMEEASGTEVSNVSKGRYSDKAHEQLLILHVFDMLCGQVDRHKGNFKYQTEGSGDNLIVKSIKCLDNDMSFGLLKYDDTSIKRNRLEPIPLSELYALPESFVKSVLSLDASFVKLILTDVLESDELDAFADRLEGFKKTLRNVEKSRAEEKGWDPSAVSKKMYRDRNVMKLYHLASLRNLDGGNYFISRSTLFTGELIPTKEEIEDMKKNLAKSLDINFEEFDIIFKKDLKL